MMASECDLCKKEWVLGSFIRCDKCMKKTSQKTCEHAEVLGNWFYVGNELSRANGFCLHCGKNHVYSKSLNKLIPEGYRAAMAREGE